MKINAKTLNEALSQLKHYSLKDTKDTLPQVTVHLSNGEKFTGWVVEMGTSIEPHSVVLQIPTGASEVNLAYINLNAISALLVHLGEPPPKEKEKEKEKVADKVDKLPVPTKQELTRKIATIQVAINSAVDSTLSIIVAWQTISEKGEALRALLELLTLVSGALQIIAANPTGKENVRRKIATIRLEQGARNMVSLSAEALNIAAPLNDGKVGFASKEDLAAKIRDAF